MNIRSLKDAAVSGKTVLLRTDYNVPADENGITNTFRIEKSLETIKYLLDNNARIVILSHRGRPKGQYSEEYSLKIVSEYLSGILDRKIAFIENPFEPENLQGIEDAPPGSVFMLENMRFHKGEKNGDRDLASIFAGIGDVYVNDGFAVSHRKHMSVYTLPSIMKECYAGFLLEDEIKNLRHLTVSPEKPYVFIIGGAKISTKLNVIRQTMNYASTVLIGGALAFTFLKASGFNVGKSLLEEDMIDNCREIFKEARDRNVNIILPVDIVAASSPESEDVRVLQRSALTDDDMGLDIGPVTVEIFRGAVESARTIAWNGPMGYFEKEQFSEGTVKIAEAVGQATDRGAFSVAGGGDSVAALSRLDKIDSVSFLSTGGGAMLEMLSGIELPGINVLKEE
ncbi:MAG: phosphoglycerate kinase [bacterium]